MPKRPSFSTASARGGLAEAILADIENLSKPVMKFMSTIFTQWWGVIGRYNFINMSRFISYSEQALRNGFRRGFPFYEFNFRLVKQKSSGSVMLAFDPSYILKSGKHTEGLDYFWSGTEQRVKKGLETGCLAAIDLENETAFHLEAVSTPAKKVRERKNQTLIDHYREFILSRIESLLTLSRYLVVDGYFMKREFILPLVKGGMHVITKMRSDANLKYLYKGPHLKRRGRKRKHAGKVDLRKIDMRRWTKVFSNKREAAYSAELFCVQLRMNVRVVYVQDKKRGTHEVFLCTDQAMKAGDIYRYYRLRFQIEFLIRDAKQHAGLQECQARDSRKLDFHFNQSFTAVNLAKAEYFLSIPKEHRDSFSLQDIKRMHHNRLITDFIFSNLGLDLNCKKIRRLRRECLNFGRLAA